MKEKCSVLAKKDIFDIQINLCTFSLLVWLLCSHSKEGRDLDLSLSVGPKSFNFLTMVVSFEVKVQLL